MAKKSSAENGSSQYQHSEDAAQTGSNGQHSADNEGKKKRREKPGRIRLIPVWLRLVLILLLAGAALIVGAMAGYAIVGDGTNPFDVFNPDTWYHIHDIIFEGTEYERD
ncbi:DNA-directed RNA polymerase subunit beta [Salisediminibacterium halotolerans]|uniref:DNA-directed RNA polymerase subunit beta n=1 Tax=Salisediminibacterium halotolerans TaxID=517425 RepID=A0A1H9QMQ5_9BACI|nr:MULTISPECIES: DNA-directed RNA polymerase subunit beta [Salisediminibacterium]RLJ75777.1 DNA-directed RNA polymerase subunit beta [Actinophytocola xinjiangensis]RPE89631.1 DNA-directed RNA polymerase subunit beta [Salisediminibacterium halotolerans]TWG36390.1 DNA-directed RNA polymerase subunit beta [Salisediminibacterium halotolerans]SER61742.1 DNA-directed RNA polymerase subunit beta [Salisediminibacterium haloalkalitolerans]GEL07532.1 hypothetical protein SHA02_09480 [Salisediminibacteri